MSLDAVCELTGPYAYDPNLVVLWIPTVADVQAPTDVEILSSVDLIEDFDLTDIIGWEVERNIIRDPPWGVFERQRPGGKRVRRNDLMFAADRSGDDVRMLWAEGDRGNVAFLPSGAYLDYPDAPLNVFPAQVVQITQLQRLRDGGASQLLVQFALTAAPGENVRVEVGS